MKILFLLYFYSITLYTPPLGYVCDVQECSVFSIKKVKIAVRRRGNVLDTIGYIQRQKERIKKIKK